MHQNAFAADHDHAAKGKSTGSRKQGREREDGKGRERNKGKNELKSLNTGMVGIDAELTVTGSASFHVPMNGRLLVNGHSLVIILLCHRLLLPVPASLSLSVS